MESAADITLTPEDLVEESGSLIALPEVCLRLRELLTNPYHSKEEVADTIIHDPALTARILRISNSAYYGLQQPIQSISHALCMIGEREVNNLVLVTSVVSSMNSIDSKTKMNLNSYWRSSIFAATIARELAKHCNYDKRDLEVFFISGLLLNIGKLLLYYKEPELLNFITEQALITSRSDFEIEREQIGFDHADVGAAMAKSWKFSDIIYTSIAEHHHKISATSESDQCIMYLSGLVSDQLDFEPAKQLQIEDMALAENEALSKLNISVKEFYIIINNSYSQYLLGYEAFCGSTG